MAGLGLHCQVCEIWAVLGEVIIQMCTLETSRGNVVSFCDVKSYMLAEIKWNHLAPPVRRAFLVLDMFFITSSSISSSRCVPYYALAKREGPTKLLL